MTTKTHPDDYSVEQLIQYYANARETHAACLGHNKSERNYHLMQQWKQFLDAKGASLPSDDKLDALAVFNGDGSS